jgi:transcriptional regulator with XRE-family HTH domain
MAQFSGRFFLANIFQLFRDGPEITSSNTARRATLLLAHAKWSRRQLAEKAGVSISTVQHLEGGRGTLTYYTLLLRALGLKLHARGRGNRKLATALRFERHHQLISRRELARHLKISRTTLSALGNNSSVRIATIEAYARAIGVELTLRPITRDGALR